MSEYHAHAMDVAGLDPAWLEELARLSQVGRFGDLETPFLDWLQLLIVPVILIAAVSLWNSSQTARDNRQADQQRQDTTLDGYFKQMSDLMLNETLVDSNPSAPVRTVAGTVTRATLRRLDRGRRSEVIRFLAESKLLSSKHGEPLISLDRADLVPVKLDATDLYGANLSYANLSGRQPQRRRLQDRRPRRR